MIDAHTHALIDGVPSLLCATDRASWRGIIANGHAAVRALGVHPWFAASATEGWRAELERHLALDER